MDSIWQWCVDHELLVWTIVSLVVLPLLRARTPEDWVSLGERYPRVQGAIRMLRGLGIDPVKVVAGLYQMLAGRASRALEQTPGPIRSAPPPPMFPPPPSPDDVDTTPGTRAP